MLRNLTVLILLLCTALAPGEARATAPGVAGALSVVPGLGQASEGEFLEGMLWFSSVVFLLFGPAWHGLDPVGPDPGASYGFFRQAGFDLWQYNMYDAYRDARPKNRNYTNYNVFQDYAAAFNPLNLIDPLGAPVVGTAAYTSYLYGYSGLHDWKRPIFFGVVGEGEEGFARGFLFPGFSDVFHSKFLGAVTSSTIFVLMHLTNGAADAFNPDAVVSRFTLGMIFCWQTNMNHYDIRKNIFAHTWYDVLVTPSPYSASRGVDGFAAGWKFFLP